MKKGLSVLLTLIVLNISSFAARLGFIDDALSWFQAGCGEVPG